MNKDYCELWVTQNNPRTKYRGGKKHDGPTNTCEKCPAFIYFSSHQFSVYMWDDKTWRDSNVLASEHQYASANAHTKNTSSCCFTCSPTGTCPHKGELLHTEGPWESGRPISASLWITHAYSIGSVFIFLSTTSASGLHNFRGYAEALVSEWVCLCFMNESGALSHECILCEWTCRKVCLHVCELTGFSGRQWR